MDPLFSRLMLTLYYLFLGSLALYGVHRLAMVALYYRTRAGSIPPPPEPDSWPRVTVQLPLYNELYVAARLIDAVSALDYPVDRLEIQVLDDSTDKTRQIVEERVAFHRARGVDIRHLHRRDRRGFKAGALAAGARRASGALLAVFDADFVPLPGFLRQTVPYFSDPGIGMVQARWDHLNRDYSLLTRVQSLFLDGHFVIEHAARNRSGRFFNFNGTAGIWRRDAIAEAGGWQHDTLTEDLDLSYRAQLKGWRFLFLPHVTVPAELPVDVNAFKRQQFRWAKGSIQTARKLLGENLRSPFGWQVKPKALIHLTCNAGYLLMVGLSLLVFPAMLLRADTDWPLLLLVDLPLFLTASVSVLIFYVVSQIGAGRSWRQGVRHLVPLMGLGIGLAINNARAVLEGLVYKGGVFERTPKYRIERSGDGWRGKSYRVPRDLSVLIEGVLAVCFVVCFGLAWILDMWPSLFFLYLFLHGYTYVFLLSVLPARS
jgi:cellulose synthase/poly-beta-1,6-N-acetylglucosamine synthase-like glycosyltransferase